MADARFEDGAEAPLRLIAVTGEDAMVISALVQDSVLTGTGLHYDRRRRRFALLLNRLRYEEGPAAAQGGRAPERVRSLLTIFDVLEASRQGIEPGNGDQILSLLSLTWTEGEEGGGIIDLILAGDGAIRLRVEALELHLEDVSRPWLAVSHKVPDHGG